MSKIPETGPFSLLDVRDDVLKSGSFNIRDRRAIWLAFLKDSKTFKGNISMSDFRGKSYDTSWVWYGGEVLHHTTPLVQNAKPEYEEGDVVSAPYVEGDYQYRWTIHKVETDSYSRCVLGHGRRRHSKYSRAPMYAWFYAYASYKRLQRRAW